MTPFNIALSMSQTWTKSCLDAQSRWLSSSTSAFNQAAQTATDTAQASAANLGLSAQRPAASWYRAPAPGWGEVTRSFGMATPDPQAFTKMMMPWLQPATAGNPFLNNPFFANPFLNNPFLNNPFQAMLTNPAAGHGLWQAAFSANPFFSMMLGGAKPSGSQAMAGTMGPFLSMQMQWLQASMTPLQMLASAMAAGSPTTSNSARPQFAAANSNGKAASATPSQAAQSARANMFPVMSGEVIPAGATGPSDTAAATTDCAIASITLPDQTTFRLTVPLNPMPAFWPWAGPFGASSYATPPVRAENNASVEMQRQNNGAATNDAQAPDRALNDTLRRSYLKTRS